MDYADGWTWFDSDGNVLSDENVSQMTTEEKAQAFLEGRYAKGESGQNAGPGGGMPDGNGPDGNEMVESYESDIASIEDGDKYGNNIVDLYNPINYIGDEDTESPTWTRIVMGASEGDMSLFASMNMQIAWLNSGTDVRLEWQWDGGHVPSEIFGESLTLYVDEMYGQYVEGAAEVTKAAAQTQTENGTATETTGASKATPGFDVMDYGQETYEFGSSTQDARHFDKYVLKVLQEDAETLSELFNSEEK